MTEEEESKLRQENTQLREAYAQIRQASEQKGQRIQELEGLLMSALLRIEELERRLAKDSHNSSLPPSRDHGTRKPMGHREKSQKRSGGQPGHQGHTLMQVETPDEVIVHRPQVCGGCQQDLSGEQGEVVERRQVHELPAWRLLIQEHQRERVCCPVCHQASTGTFPEAVKAPVQYGPRVQALAVYLSQYQLLSLQRTCETMADLCQAPISQAALRHWITEAASTLTPALERISTLLKRSKLLHVDETSVHVGGKVHWVHEHGTQWLTWYSWHRKRGAEGIEAVGLIPQYRGRMMHDRWYSYDRYPCTHSLCGAHLIRDTIFVAEHEKQPWAGRMVEHLRQMLHVTHDWRARGAQRLPSELRRELLAEYFEIVRTGSAAHAARSMPPPVSKGGRKKQKPSLNLLDTFLKRAEQILGFVEDLRVPFTNNLAERDLRMIKVQQKISGTFRSLDGLSAFCALRSYLSTMRKQGRPLLEALRAALTGTPFPIAWEPGT